MEPVLNNLSDAELLQKYSEGDETAFRELVSRYKNGLYAFLKRFLNQRDLIDDVLISGTSVWWRVLEVAVGALAVIFLAGLVLRWRAGRRDSV